MASRMNAVIQSENSGVSAAPTGRALPRYARVDRLVAQRLELLWNWLKKSDAKRSSHAQRTSARRLIRTDHRWIVE